MQCFAEEAISTTSSAQSIALCGADQEPPEFSHDGPRWLRGPEKIKDGILLLVHFTFDISAMLCTGSDLLLRVLE